MIVIYLHSAPHHRHQHQSWCFSCSRPEDLVLVTHSRWMLMMNCLMHDHQSPSSSSGSLELPSTWDDSDMIWCCPLLNHWKIIQLSMMMKNRISTWCWRLVLMIVLEFSCLLSQDAWLSSVSHSLFCSDSHWSDSHPATSPCHPSSCRNILKTIGE